MDDTPRRILVVDDEANARTALAEILRLEGYAIETAADGRAALECFADFEPDLVLTDVMMPVMNGLELLEHVRADHPDVPVVLMAAREPKPAARARCQGGVCLLKPLDVDELLAVLERALRRRNATASAAATNPRSPHPT